MWPAASDWGLSYSPFSSGVFAPAGSLDDAGQQQVAGSN